MNSDTPLDFALFQLSPRRSRCELFVSADGKTEKLASGLLKPFVSHLKAAEEQATQSIQSIKLEIEKRGHGGSWFRKGTLERLGMHVCQVCQYPEVLEVVSTLDAEMSQLEVARRIYFQGAGDPLSGTSPEEAETAETTAADVTKKELLRAIDLRLAAVKQDLTMACARASAAGFTLESISDLRLFADHFGAHRLNVACSKFVSLCQRQPELMTRPQERQQPSTPPPVTWNGPPLGFADRDVRGSSGSDMSIDDPEDAAASTIPTAGPSAARPLSGPWPSSNTSGSNSGHHQPQRPFRARSAEPPSHQEQKAPSLTKSSSSQKIVNESELKSSEAQPVGGSRRLSVQDRISLFESKQKEQSGGGVIGGIGGKAGGKPELRRLVLRRWSGASDMSIDLSSSNSNSNTRKETEIASGTPSSSTTSNAQVCVKNEEKDTADSQPRSAGDNLQSVLPFSSSKGESLSSGKGSDQERMLSRRTSLKEKADSQVESMASVRLSENQACLKASSGVINKEPKNRSSSFVQQKPLAGAVEHPGTVAVPRNQVKVSTVTGQVAQKEKETSQRAQPSTAFSGRVTHVRNQETRTTESPPTLAVRPTPGQFENGPVDLQVCLTQSKASGDKAEGMGSNKKGTVRSQVQQKIPMDKAEVSAVKSEKLGAQSRGKYFVSKPEEVRKLEPVSHAQGGDLFSRLKDEDSDVQEKQVSAPSQKRFRDRVNERVPARDIHSHAHESPTHAVRSSKGNQELNDELQMKADELEKLFAAHKLRLHADQTSALRRGKAVDQPVDNRRATERRSTNVLPDSLSEGRLTRLPPNKRVESNPDLLTDNQDYVNMPRQNLFNPISSDESRGKFYERYMQKRDAKLREEWDSKRTQKEAKMKKMRDDLERSKAEMKANFSGSAERLDSVLSAHRRAERLRSFSLNFAMKSQGQQHVEFFKSEEDEDKESSRSSQCGPDTFFSEPALGGSSSKSSNSRKLLSSSSSTGVSRPSLRGANSSSGRSNLRPEDILAQSGPDFPDLRKETAMASSSGASRDPTRSHLRSSTRSKSISEDINLVREEKPRRCQSMRKAPPIPGGLTAVTSDGFVQAKGLLRRGGKSEALYASENLNSAEDAMARDSPAASDNEKLSMSQGSGDSGYPCSENGRDSPSPSQMDDDSAAALVTVSSKFSSSTGPAPESSGESHEASEGESQSVSPASWSSHPLNHAEADVSRMRKKWGNAQKPIMISHSSNPSRKESSIGFKRLLTFGRKNKGAESPVIDWVSASTTASEGEDDAEDARDPSGDLRKPRMGVSHCHYLHDGFNAEADYLHEQGTTFFGVAHIILTSCAVVLLLSSLRAKGADQGRVIILFLSSSGCRNVSFWYDHGWLV
ncbi:unnamed protein product [Spirodela intermedia]|uniref:Uncharacterized protein n=1 Tax=Spirodela intermedia TaxID=51605 RepID=A0A7I8J3N6_SPIIN|nr:unnamed protein product [Spirodela intermedia]CAA6664613.1 unnamed protein product [Spirodela intermedia]